VYHIKKTIFYLFYYALIIKGNDFLMICLKHWSNVTECKKIYLIFRRRLFTFIPESSAELYLNRSYNKSLSTVTWLKILYFMQRKSSILRYKIFFEISRLSTLGGVYDII